MRLAPVASALTIGLLLAAGCGSSGAKIAPRAVEEAAAAFGGASRTLELSGDEVSRLAAEGDVTDDAIRSMAPQADTQPLWRRSLDAARTVNQRTEGDTRDTALGVACDAVNGKVSSTDELYASLAGQIQGLSQPELESIAQATVDMWQDLYDARTSEDPDQRSAAVLTCFTLQSVS
jgi:hypothetical protein